MRAGAMRHRVVIESIVHFQDDTSGEMRPVWQPDCICWASIEPLSTRDFIAAQAGQTELSARIKIRRRNIKPTSRIIHRDRVFNILGVLPDIKSGLDYMTLAVSEGVNDAG